MDQRPSSDGVVMQTATRGRFLSWELTPRNRSYPVPAEHAQYSADPFQPTPPRRIRSESDPGPLPLQSHSSYELNHSRAYHEVSNDLPDQDLTPVSNILSDQDISPVNLSNCLLDQDLSPVPDSSAHVPWPWATTCGPDQKDRVPLAKVNVLLAVWAFSGLSWVIGLAFPSAIVIIFPDTNFAKTDIRSVLELIKLLWEKQLLFSLLLIAAFSLLVPAGKIFCTGRFLLEMRDKNRMEVARGNAKLLKVMHYSASYQMLDIYVGILFISYFNCDSSSATFGPGFYWFFIYCFISTVISQVIDRELHDAMNAEILGLDQVTEDDNEKNTDTCTKMGVWFFSFAYVTSMLVVIVSNQPLLEVRTLFNGITIDRRALSLGDMMFFSVPNYTHPIVTTLVLIFCVFLPVLYTILALAPYLGSNKAEMNSDHVALRIARKLQPWVMTDVLCLASYVFLFVVQGEETATRPPSGSWMFYVFLGSGFSFFFLRWFAEPEEDPRIKALRSMKQQYDVGTQSRFRIPRFGSFGDQDWSEPTSRDALAEEEGEGSSNSNLYYQGRVFSRASARQSKRSLAATPAHSSSMDRNRKAVHFWGCVVAWCLCCGVLLPGIPGQVPVYSFHSLPQICAKSMPVVNAALKHLPISLGDCGNYEIPPPFPCVGDKPLYSVDQGYKGYIKANWIGGFNTMSLDFCNLARTPADLNATPPSGKVKYTLSLGGFFANLDMYIKAKQCSSLGCMSLNGPEYCCGQDITFSLTFEMECTNGRQPNQVSSVVLTQFQLDKILVKLETSNDHLPQGKALHSFGQIEVADITEIMRDAVSIKLHRFLHGATMVWGGKSLDVPEFLSKLVAYNAPLAEFQC